MDGRKDDLQNANRTKPQMKNSEEENDANRDDAAVQRLQQGLDALEDLFPATRPSAAWFDQQIAAARIKHRTRLFGDLFKLWCAGLLLLSLLYMTAAAQPFVFMTFQALAIIAPLTWLFLRKQVDSHES
ncbi:DUF5345 family protein [Paenibacillus aceris]|uniref:YxlC family protein n=1 Tax=Paenibacillus aceris TaxID=869555 RepID=A0ABS4HZD9_9BACL|nr:DUF5345 family protein [Paenibacillus aceris]MBP1964037.1 hypothetical protein [Paenibacillus aceris]NHW34548.1 YxlC family protein [Paenibacillus aceris]